MKKSDSIKEISSALCKLGAELGNVSKNKVNPFYKSKYADLASILDYVKTPLANNGLSIVQSSVQAGQKILIIETLLTHESGEWIETEIELPANHKEKYDAQTVGSAFTYGRRYALSAILNISSEEDNDGNKIPEKPVKESLPTPKQELKQQGDFNKAIEHLNTKCDDISKINQFAEQLELKLWAEGEKEQLLMHAGEKKKVLIGIDNVVDKFDGDILPSGAI